MGGGEVARYMTKYNGAGIVQAGLIASIVPYKLKTPDNPHGTEEKLLDETIAAIKEDRPKFFAEFFKKFYGVDTAETTGERGSAAMVVEHGDAGRAQADARLRRFVLQDGFPAGPGVVQSADAHHSRNGATRTWRSMRRRRPAAKGIKNSKLIEYRRLAAWPAGHGQTTRDRSPAGVPRRAERTYCLR